MKKLSLKIDRMTTIPGGPDPAQFALEIEQSLAYLAGMRNGGGGSSEAQRIAMLAWEAVQRARLERRSGG